MLLPAGLAALPVAIAPRHRVVASGLPSWPPGRWSVSLAIGSVVELLNDVVTCSEGDSTGSLFGHEGDAVHVTVGLLGLPSRTNAPFCPFRKLPGAVKMSFAATLDGTGVPANRACVSVGLDASRVTVNALRVAALAAAGASAQSSSAPTRQTSRQRRPDALVWFGLSPWAAGGVR